jgi:Xaa-Pro aminopeptidase
MARTGVVGRPTPTQSKRYEAVYEAQRQTIEAMKPGAVAGDLWRISAKVLKSYGYSLDSPHIGHSVGVGLHEEPMIQPRNSAVLELGMVCYIEPAFSPVPRDEYHVEDLVAVTEEGGKVLSDPHETRAELFVL